MKTWFAGLLVAFSLAAVLNILLPISTAYAEEDGGGGGTELGNEVRDVPGS